MANNSTGNRIICRKNHTSFAFLLVLLIVSMVCGTFAVISLESEDRISIERGAFLFFTGFVFFTALFYFINHMGLKTTWGIRFKKRFRLNSMDVLDISNKLVSSVQAALSCLTGVIVVTYSCTRSLLKTSHFVSEAYAWFGASYFFYDIWSMYKVHTILLEKYDFKNNYTTATTTIVNNKEQKRSTFFKFWDYIKSQPIILMHHIFIGSFGFLVIVYLRGGLGDCVFGYVYLMELSTPCVSLRGILSKLGLKQTKTYVANGLIMLVTFFFCRVAMFPYVCYLYAQVVEKPYFEAILSLPRGCKIGILILLLPQFYWFWLMLKGAFKVFCSPKIILHKKIRDNQQTPTATTTTTSTIQKNTSTTKNYANTNKKQKKLTNSNHHNS